MVGVEELASLDFVLWRRTGKQAASALGCNQSTISRRLGRCLQVFQLKMRRISNEWDLPFSLLLQMERELHQQCRLLGHLPLRLEACPRRAPCSPNPCQRAGSAAVTTTSAWNGRCSCCGSG